MTGARESAESRVVIDGAGDDRLIFGACGRLPFDSERATALVETMLHDRREGPLHDEWQAAARAYLSACTDSQRDYAAETLRQIHRLHLSLFGITATTKSQ